MAARGDSLQSIHDAKYRSSPCFVESVAVSYLSVKQARTGASSDTHVYSAQLGVDDIDNSSLNLVNLCPGV